MDIKMNRNSNIEFLRIILIIVIIIHHLIVHGSYLTDMTNLSQTFGAYQKLAIEAFLLFPVDCFILISGFYGIKLKLYKVFDLWVKCLFYSVLITIFFKYSLRSDVGLNGMVYIPYKFSAWWFIDAYIVLMLISPILNNIAEKLVKPFFEYILISGLCLNFLIGGGGSNIYNFIYIYLVGRYFKLYGFLNLNMVRTIVGFFICGTIILLLTIFDFTFLDGDYVWYLYRFNNPLIIFQAICIFFVFYNIRMKSRLINYIASTVFAVYLIHDHHLVRSFLYKKVLIINVYSEKLSYIIYLILFAVIILFCCVLIESIRIKLMNPFLKAFYLSKTLKKIELKI